MSSETPRALGPVAAPRHRACSVWDVPRGGVKILTVAGVELGLYSIGGKIVAYRNVCPHAGAPVCSGKLTGTALPTEVYSYAWGRAGEILRCPWHGWEFDLVTGAHLADPQTRLRSYPVVVIENDVFVEL
jgi:nitrite reductase (NADH) small subunit